MSQFSMENIEYKPSYGYRRFLVAGLNLALEQTESSLGEAKTRKEFVINSNKKSVMSHLKTGLLMLSDQEFNETLESVFEDVFKMESNDKDEIDGNDFHCLTQSTFHSLFRKIDICEQYDKITIKEEDIDGYMGSRVDGFSLARLERKHDGDDPFVFNKRTPLSPYGDMLVYLGMRYSKEFDDLFKKISDQYLSSRKENLQ